jgi:hypothetical protein
MLEWRRVVTWLRDQTNDTAVTYLSSIPYKLRHVAGQMFGHEGVVPMSAYHAESVRRTHSVLCEEQSVVMSMSRSEYLSICLGDEHLMGQQAKIEALKRCKQLCLFKDLDIAVHAYLIPPPLPPPPPLPLPSTPFSHLLSPHLRERPLPFFLQHPSRSLTIP